MKFLFCFIFVIFYSKAQAHPMDRYREDIIELIRNDYYNEKSIKYYLSLNPQYVENLFYDIFKENLKNPNDLIFSYHYLGLIKDRVLAHGPEIDSLLKNLIASGRSTDEKKIQTLIKILADSCNLQKNSNLCHILKKNMLNLYEKNLNLFTEINRMLPPNDKIIYDIWASIYERFPTLENIGNIYFSEHPEHIQKLNELFISDQLPDLYFYDRMKETGIIFRFNQDALNKIKNNFKLKPNEISFSLLMRSSASDFEIEDLLYQFLKEMGDCFSKKEPFCSSSVFSNQFSKQEYFNFLNSLANDSRRPPIRIASEIKKQNKIIFPGGKPILPLNNYNQSILHQFPYEEVTKQTGEKNYFELILENESPFIGNEVWVEHSRHYKIEINDQNLKKILQGREYRVQQYNQSYLQFEKESGYILSPFSALKKSLTEIQESSRPSQKKKFAIPPEQQALFDMQNRYPQKQSSDFMKFPLSREYNSLVWKYSDQESKKLKTKSSLNLSDQEFIRWRDQQVELIKRNYKNNIIKLLETGDFDYLDDIGEKIPLDLVKKLNINPLSVGNDLIEGQPYFHARLLPKKISNEISAIMNPRHSMTLEEHLRATALLYAHLASKSYHADALYRLEVDNLKDFKKLFESVPKELFQTEVLFKKGASKILWPNNNNNLALDYLWEKLEHSPDHWKARERLAQLNHAPFVLDALDEMEKRLTKDAAKNPGHSPTHNRTNANLKSQISSNTPLEKGDPQVLYEIDAHAKIKQLNIAYAEDHHRMTERWRPTHHLKNKENNFKLKSMSASPDIDQVIPIPMADGHQLEQIKVFNEQGLEAVLGRDYEIALDPQTKNASIKIISEQLDKIHFEASFSPSPHFSLEDLSWRSLQKKELMPLIIQLEEAGFKRLSDDLKKMFKKLKDNEIIDISEIEAAFKKSAFYTFQKETGIMQSIEGNPFNQFSRFLNSKGIMCAQCDGSNAFFTVFMQEYYKKTHPDIFVELGTSYSRSGKQEFLTAENLHARTIFYKKEKGGKIIKLGIMDVTPSKMKSSEALKKWFRDLYVEIKLYFQKKFGPPPLPSLGALPGKVLPIKVLQIAEDHSQLAQNIFSQKTEEHQAQRIKGYLNKLGQDLTEFISWAEKNKENANLIIHGPSGKIYLLSKRYRDFLHEEKDPSIVLSELKKTFPEMTWPEAPEFEKIKMALEQNIKGQHQIFLKYLNNKTLVNKYPFLKNPVLQLHLNSLISRINHLSTNFSSEQIINYLKQRRKICTPDLLIINNTSKQLDNF